MCIGALCLGLVIGGNLYWAWNTIRDRRLEGETSRPREWGPTVVSLRVDAPRITGGRGPFLVAAAQTRCSLSRLYYRLTVRKNPDCCRGPDERAGTDTLRSVLFDLADVDELLGPGAQFTVRLLDGKGATLKALTVSRRHLHLGVDASGVIGSAEATGEMPWDCRAYGRVTQAAIEWHGR